MVQTFSKIYLFQFMVFVNAFSNFSFVCSNNLKWAYNTTICLLFVLKEMSNRVVSFSNQQIELGLLFNARGHLLWGLKFESHFTRNKRELGRWRARPPMTGSACGRPRQPRPAQRLRKPGRWTAESKQPRGATRTWAQLARLGASPDQP